MAKYNILIDSREFNHESLTGIGRVLEGLIYALTEHGNMNIFLAIHDTMTIPSGLRNLNFLKTKTIPSSFMRSEKTVSNLTKSNFDLFVSPYPKLPFFGCFCPSIHIIHDILDLTHPAYRKRIKASFDRFRLNSALRKADLTWYDSSWSMDETKKFTGIVGKNPKVRYPGIGDRFIVENMGNRNIILNKYKLHPGYILVIGNGMPHKNLGILLSISEQITREIVFIGVKKENQVHWESKYPKAKKTWIEHAEDDDLPSLICGAFCLAQPSTAEGYGFPPLEAMVCGIPTVVSNIPVLIETSGGNALFADPNNPKDWTEAINALEDNNRYKEQVKKGLKWVAPLKGRKGWQKHVADIEELISRQN